jgi:parvulin-like peptidyl-prolyl isomerase
LRGLLREPLVHFLVLGLALFAGYRWLAGDDGGGRRIVVDDARVAFIRAQFKTTWNRDPTDAELRGLVDGAVRDEIFYREGEALGLDRDDPVVMRRVRQKYEVLAEEMMSQEAPTDADLGQWLAAHPEKYARPAELTFTQILVAAEDAASDAGAATDAARRALARGVDPGSLGLRTMLPPHEDAVGLDRVARDYGPAFADALAAAPVGEWQGPIESAYGAHLVRVEARVAGRNPSLGEARPQVMRDWEGARRERAIEAKLAELREKYDVVIEAALPAPAAR